MLGLQLYRYVSTYSSLRRWRRRRRRRRHQRNPSVSRHIWPPVSLGVCSMLRVSFHTILYHHLTTADCDPCVATMQTVAQSQMSFRTTPTSRWNRASPVVRPKTTPSLAWSTVSSAVSQFSLRRRVHNSYLLVCGDNLVNGAAVAEDDGCNMGCGGNSTCVCS